MPAQAFAGFLAGRTAGKVVGPAIASRYGTAPLVAGCIAGVAATQLWLGLAVSAAERVSFELGLSLIHI